MKSRCFICQTRQKARIVFLFLALLASMGSQNGAWAQAEGSRVSLDQVSLDQIETALHQREAIFLNLQTNWRIRWEIPPNPLAADEQLRRGQQGLTKVQVDGRRTHFFVQETVQETTHLSEGSMDSPVDRYWHWLLPQAVISDDLLTDYLRNKDHYPAGTPTIDPIRLPLVIEPAWTWTSFQEGTGNPFTRFIFLGCDPLPWLQEGRVKVSRRGNQIILEGQWRSHPQGTEVEWSGWSLAAGVEPPFPLIHARHGIPGRVILIVDEHRGFAITEALYEWKSSDEKRTFRMQTRVQKWRKVGPLWVPEQAVGYYDFSPHPQNPEFHLRSVVHYDLQQASFRSGNEKTALELPRDNLVIDFRLHPEKPVKYQFEGDQPSDLPSLAVLEQKWQEQQKEQGETQHFSQANVNAWQGAAPLTLIFAGFLWYRRGKKEKKEKVE